MLKRIPALLAILAPLILILVPVVSGLTADGQEAEEISVERSEEYYIQEIMSRPDYIPKPLLLQDEIPLDVNTQISIYGQCGYDRYLFCAVMAIAATESDFDPAAVGDEGISGGMFQINTVAQAERIEELGVTDLTDPIQCAKVAVDYIGWLADRIEAEDLYSSHELYMAYNMGLQGSLDARAEGISETRYSREAVGYYTEFLEIVNGRM